MIDRLLERLTKVAPPRLHLGHLTEAEVGGLRYRLATLPDGRRSSVHVLRGRRMTSPDGLWDELACAFRLQLSFGRGWAALDDSLKTLELDPAEVHTTIILDADRLADAARLTLRALIGVLGDAGDWWSKPYDGVFPHPPTPFHVICVGPGDRLDDLDQVADEATDWPRSVFGDREASGHGQQSDAATNPGQSG
jgi:hypothetical protein